MAGLVEERKAVLDIVLKACKACRDVQKT